jgi:hypothetical protein
MRWALAITTANLHRAAQAHVLRQASVVLLIGAVFSWSAGITLVVPHSSEHPAGVHESDEWFSCKGHGCGCTSAEICRTSCCCRRPIAPPESAKSYCPGEATEAGRKRTKASAADATGVKLVIRSPSCAGRSAFWVLTFACPPVRLDRFVFHLRVSPERPDAHELVIRDLFTLTPDPPPPREC